MPYRPLVSKIRVHNPNKKGAVSANRNYITYIATRDGVSLENVQGSDSVTEITDLETDSEEEYVQRHADNKSYMNYITYRPRSHGLFGNIDTDDLKNVAAQIAELTQEGKIIYRGIISLSGKDAEALGYRNANAWYNYLKGTMPDIAQKLGISSYDHTWVAAFHGEEGHPHVHYMLWDNKECIRSAFIHPAKQEEIRIMLEKEMFNNEYEKAIRLAAASELDELNKTYHQSRTDILADIENLMDELGYVDGVMYERLPVRPSKEYLKDLTDEIEGFIRELPGEGRIAYQFLSPDLKEHMEKIVDLILEKQDIRKEMEHCLECVRKRNALYGYTEKKIAHEVEKQKAEIRKRIANKVLHQIKPVIQREHFAGAELSSVQEEDMRAELSSVREEDMGAELSSVREEDMGAELSSVQGGYWEYQQGKRYVDKGDQERYDLGKAVEYFEKAAEKGNEHAKYRLGKLYGDREDQERYDPAKAIRYLESIEKLEGGYREYQLGKLYGDREDEDRYDLGKAVEYFEKAAEKGNEHAKYRLGVIYADPESGALFQRSKAETYLIAAAKKENQYAQYRLGNFYLDAEYMETWNAKEGIFWMEKAAGKGYVHAQCKLGIMYYFGKGVEKDLGLGKFWLEQAADNGNQMAKNILNHRSIGIDFSYCLIKGVLSSMEGLNRQVSQDYAAAARVQSAQVRRENQLHRDHNQDR